MNTKILASAFALALALTACGGGDTDTVEEAVTGGQSVTVNVDGESEGSNVAFLGYFPHEVTVRQGDTIDFDFRPGDPHSVSFGTLIDEAAAWMATAEEGDEPPAAMMQIPFAFDETDNSLNYAGALPCFTADDPPADGSPCEQGDQPAFDGSHTLYNSGLLEPAATFSMPVAEDAAPGTYSYICLLHGPDMFGQVTVVGADESAPSPAEVATAAQADLAAAIAEAKPVLDAQPSGTAVGFEELLPSGPGQVLVGALAGERVPTDVLQFGPDEVSVDAGDAVTWSVLGFHTISFNATQDATPAIIPGEDELPITNPLAFAPQGGSPGAPPPPEGEGPPPEGPPGPPTVIDAGEWDGSGFFSSGVLPSFPPALFGYRITFTTPGTYPYVCLIHPDMEGTVTVN